MSAESYTYCPRCYESEEVATERLYGKVPLDEFTEAIGAIREKAQKGQDRTLAEYYEIRVHGSGESTYLEIHYSCGCNCGFGWKWEHTVGVPVQELSGPPERAPRRKR